MKCVLICHIWKVLLIWYGKDSCCQILKTMFLVSVQNQGQNFFIQGIFFTHFYIICYNVWKMIRIIMSKLHSEWRKSMIMVIFQVCAVMVRLERWHWICSDKFILAIWMTSNLFTFESKEFCFQPAAMTTLHSRNCGFWSTMTERTRQNIPEQLWLRLF